VLSQVEAFADLGDILAEELGDLGNEDFV